MRLRLRLDSGDLPEMNAARAQAILPILLATTVLSGAAAAAPGSPIRVTRVDYRGWSGCVLLSNGLVEAVVVPAVGRIMQFRFAGAPDGPFWENASLDGGRLHAPATSDWANFGGDKAFPAPQSDWPRLIRRSWPPPAGFDGLPMHAPIPALTTGAPSAGVTLVSQSTPTTAFA